MAKSRPAATPLVRPPAVVLPAPVYRPPEPAADPAPPSPPAPAPAPAAAEPEYSWPSKVRCPYCGRTDHKIEGTKGPIRYLRCRHPSCIGRNRPAIKVMGNRI